MRKEKPTKFYGNIELIDDETNERTHIDKVWLTIEKNNIYIDVGGHYLYHKTWKLIKGEFTGLDKVSFIGCSGGGESKTGFAGTASRIKVQTVIRDMHFPSYDEVKIHGMRMFSAALDRWIQHSERIDEPKPWTFKVPPKEEIARFEANGVAVTINSANLAYQERRSVSISGITTINLKSKDALHIDEFNKLYVAIKKLILFLTNSNPEYDQVWVTDQDDSEYEVNRIRRDLKQEEFTQNIKLYYLPLRKQINTFFQKWVEDKNLDMVLDLVLERQYNTSISSASYFFNICIALESFHDKLNPKAKKEKSKKIKPLIEHIRGKIEDDQALELFDSESEYWSKPTFIEKANFYAPMMEQVMGDIFPKGIEDLLTRIKQTRNEIAHQGNYYKRFNRIEIFLVGKLMEFTLKIEILRFFSIDVDNKPRSFIDAGRSHLEALAISSKYYKRP